MNDEATYFVPRKDAIDILEKHQARAQSLQSEIQKFHTGWVRGIFAVAAVGAGVLSLSYASSQDMMNLYVGAGLAFTGVASKVFGDRFFGLKSELYKQVGKFCENKKLGLIQNTKAKKYNVQEFDSYIDKTINKLTNNEPHKLNKHLAKNAFRDWDHRIGFGYIAMTIASAGVALYVSNKEVIDALINNRNESDQVTIEGEEQTKKTLVQPTP